jgi:hypothetical protein
MTGPSSGTNENLSGDCDAIPCQNKDLNQSAPGASLKIRMDALSVRGNRIRIRISTFLDARRSCFYYSSKPYRRALLEKPPRFGPL